MSIQSDPLRTCGVCGESYSNIRKAQACEADHRREYGSSVTTDGTASVVAAASATIDTLLDWWKNRRKK